jgi:hypothetical protein
MILLNRTLDFSLSVTKSLPLTKNERIQVSKINEVIAALTHGGTHSTSSPS